MIVLNDELGVTDLTFTFLLVDTFLVMSRDLG